MGHLTYVILKLVSNLVADLNIVSNPEFFTRFCTSSHVFDAKNNKERAIFY